MNRPVGYLGVLYILGPIITSLLATALIVRSRSRFGWLLAAGYLIASGRPATSTRPPTDSSSPIRVPLGGAGRSSTSRGSRGGCRWRKATWWFLPPFPRVMRMRTLVT
jgi:hypothetical protein